MVLRFGIGGIKITAFIGTGTIFLMGLALTLFGIVYNKKFDTVKHILEGGLEIPSQVTMYLGIIYMVLALIGLFAIYINGYGLLVLYNILVFVLFLVSLVFGVIMTGNAKGDESKYVIRIRNKIAEIPPNELDILQTWFGCCGINSYKDYHNLWQYWEIPTQKTFTDKKQFDQTFVYPQGFTQHTLHPKVEPMMPGRRKMDNKILGKKENATIKGKGKREKTKWQKLPININLQGDFELKELPPQPQKNVWRTYNATKQEGIAKQSKSKVGPKKSSKKPAPPKSKARKEEELINLIFDTQRKEKEPSLRFITDFKKIVTSFTMKMCKYVMTSVYRTKNKKFNWDSVFTQISSFMDSYYEFIKEVWYLRYKPWKATRRWYYSDWSNADFLMRAIPLTSINPDNLYYYHATIDVLPYSCCKNPSKNCNGLYTQTFQIGCRPRIINYFRLSTIELSTMTLMFSIAVLQSFIINVLFIQGVRESYYF